MNILITGDLVIDKDYKTANIDNSVKTLFKNSDYNIINLEAPVTSSTSRIIKTGPHLKSNKKSTLETLKTLRIDAVTLANNHLRDYDDQGVTDTLAFCEENNIQAIGAGKNLNEAVQTKYLETKEGIIGFVNFAENEWSSATDKSAGAHPMDIIDNAKKIKEAKEKADYVFVIIHGGHEYYNLPSPRMQKQYRFYAEQGADIVIGHHTHCISGHEVHKGIPIYYSLGNFLFTKHSPHVDWYNGIILKIEISNEKNIKAYPVFVKQNQSNFELSLMVSEELSDIQNRFKKYSQLIQDDLKTEWDKYIKHKGKMYINNWSVNVFLKNRYLRAVLSKLGITISSNRGRSVFLNMMRCEAHADLSKATLNKSLKK